VDVPACTACGACCFTDRADWIAVFAVDEARMDPAALALTHLVDGRRFMRVRDGRCAALGVAGGQYLCGIYASRPDACRWLERSGGECLVQIRDKRAVALAAS
jgi:Fe-S-cluster containining protein